MDDSCAVCADPLEWVAYGPCGHREVCSTCVVRLRFVLGDRRCCICKTECPIIFVTKALGDYTRVVADFSVFLTGATEGKTGQYWYHEDTQAYFDDADHYKMIKAMCRLSCSICDNNSESQGGESTKRRTRFRSIEQLNGHLRHQHNLFMCNLCLEGRKVFICEQKLYTRSQLNQHKSTGDSEVDGTESERGGFMGHPMCEFCRNRFYGDNELYMHMSTEHYTCHICQRQHPGQYDYFRDYNDLEMHFRQEHFLCENEACLEKKFIVFQTEAEMKRHNALEHGGNMSRSMRNAALRIPTSFRYRRNEQEQRRGRGRGFRQNSSGDQLTMAIQASLETAADADGRFQDSSFGAHSDSGNRRMRRVDTGTGSSEVSTVHEGPEGPLNQSTRTTPILEESSFPPLSDRELPEPSSRYAQALSQSSRNPAKLREESFPPLPGVTNKAKPSHGSEGLSTNTLAARLQRKRDSVVINSAPARPLEYHEMFPSASQLRTTPNHGITASTFSSSQPRAPTRENLFISPSPASSSVNSDAANRMKHSASVPNLASGSFSSQAVPIVKREESSTSSNQSHTSTNDVYAVNKSMVEQIRASLGMDEDKYSAFKSISLEYRQDLINTLEYLSYVEQFGLSHLVLELAHLCPDAQKQKELIDAYNLNLRNKTLRENAGISDGRKGKGKTSARAISKANNKLSDNFLDTVKKLQLNQKAQEEEVLHKDGYQASKDQPRSSGVANSGAIDVNFIETSVDREPQFVTGMTKQNLADGGSSKQRKKTSKFNRVRLGDGSAAALFDPSRRDAIPEPQENRNADGSSETQPVRGVWRSGGAQRLFANSSKNA
ncbi:E3 ubiquitin-protein ligase hel2-like [Zingiber officinale]|nr:E3 ubiquitin-protein ligase hel2-like [Zingiber officinale]